MVLSSERCMNLIYFRGVQSWAYLPISDQQISCLNKKCFISFETNLKIWSFVKVYEQYFSNSLATLALIVVLYLYIGYRSFDQSVVDISYNDLNRWMPENHHPRKDGDFSGIHLLKLLWWFYPVTKTTGGYHESIRDSATVTGIHQ